MIRVGKSGSYDALICIPKILYNILKLSLWCFFLLIEILAANREFLVLFRRTENIEWRLFRGPCSFFLNFVFINPSTGLFWIKHIGIVFWFFLSQNDNFFFFFFLFLFSIFVYFRAMRDGDFMIHFNWQKQIYNTK